MKRRARAANSQTVARGLTNGWEPNQEHTLLAGNQRLLVKLEFLTAQFMGAVLVLVLPAGVVDWDKAVYIS